MCCIILLLWSTSLWVNYKRLYMRKILGYFPGSDQVLIEDRLTSLRDRVMPALLREEKDSGTSPRSVPDNHSSCSDYIEDQDEALPLVFRKPCWQLYATLISTLSTPLLYRVYLILVTIGGALFSNGTSGSYTNPCKCLVCLAIVLFKIYTGNLSLARLR